MSTVDFLKIFFGMRVVRRRRTVRRVRLSRMSRTQSKKQYAELKDDALVLVTQRLMHFNTQYSFTYKNVCIRNQVSRWGSCSSKGNLNFNYRIVLLPQKLSDYIIVHELCHLGQFNHSQKFWNLVGQTIPDYKEIKDELQKQSINFF